MTAGLMSMNFTDADDYGLQILFILGKIPSCKVRIYLDTPRAMAGLLIQLQ